MSLRCSSAPFASEVRKAKTEAKGCGTVDLWDASGCDHGRQGIDGAAVFLGVNISVGLSCLRAAVNIRNGAAVVELRSRDVRATSGYNDSRGYSNTRRRLFLLRPIVVASHVHLFTTVYFSMQTEIASRIGDEWTCRPSGVDNGEEQMLGEYHLNQGMVKVDLCDRDLERRH